MKRFEFTITIAGYSDVGNPDEAWLDACEGFGLDYGVCPDDYTSEEAEED